jgi:hypothetical protein
MFTYEPGDYVKVEFPDEATGIGEWMWVRIHRCDDQRRLIFGTLDNEIDSQTLSRSPWHLENRTRTYATRNAPR